MIKKYHVNLIASYDHNNYQNNNKMQSGFIQLPAKYPQLPAYLIGQIETLIWGISAPDPPSSDDPL